MNFNFRSCLRKGHGTCVPLFKLGIPATAVLPIDAAIITRGVVPAEYRRTVSRL